jgi:hypothetical protein
LLDPVSSYSLLIHGVAEASHRRADGGLPYSDSTIAPFAAFTDGASRRSVLLPLALQAQPQDIRAADLPDAEPGQLRICHRLSYDRLVLTVTSSPLYLSILESIHYGTQQLGPRPITAERQYVL